MTPNLTPTLTPRTGEVGTILSTEARKPPLREGDIDSDHYYGLDDDQDQQLPQDLKLLLRLHRIALLQGVEPGVEPAGGQELLVGANLRDVPVLDHEDLVHAPHQS